MGGFSLCGPGCGHTHARPERASPVLSSAARGGGGRLCAGLWPFCRGQEASSLAVGEAGGPEVPFLALQGPRHCVIIQGSLPQSWNPQPPGAGREGPGTCGPAGEGPREGLTLPWAGLEPWVTSCLLAVSPRLSEALCLLRVTSREARAGPGRGPACVRSPRIGRLWEPRSRGLGSAGAGCSQPSSWPDAGAISLTCGPPAGVRAGSAPLPVCGCLGGRDVTSQRCWKR